MVVVFDLDDTLYPESAYVLSALRAVGELGESRLGLTGFTAALRRLFESGQRTQLFQTAIAELNRPAPTAEDLEVLLAAYRNHRPERLDWHPDALVLVQALHARHPLAIISDGYMPTQRLKAEALGVDRWFTPVVFTEEFGRAFWKPSAHAFESVMQAFPGESFVYIGDNLAKDFVAPRALGWNTVYVRRPDGIHKDALPPANGTPRYEVSDLASAAALLSA
jgi:putative hydrolase of the HAD superfamily